MKPNMKFAVLIFLMSMLYIFCVTFFPVIDKETAKYVVGFLLGTGFATFVQYYWGSSEGSAKKSEDLSKIINGTKICKKCGGQIKDGRCIKCGEECK